MKCPFCDYKLTDRAILNDQCQHCDRGVNAPVEKNRILRERGKKRAKKS